MLKHRLNGVLLVVSLYLLVSVVSTHDPPYPPNNGNHNDSSHGSHGVNVVSWNYEYVEVPLLLGIFLVVICVLKLLFHYAECLSSVVPESCLLIVFGVAVGAIFHFGFSISEFRLDPRHFMLFLLPPIVLDSAYSLNDRCFAENVGSILVYAVFGTLFNFFAIGSTLYGINVSGAMGSIQLSFVHCLLFSSFIVAVDPVAVLAIFQEVGVNNVLYFLVFGESLLNDAVTVVLYNMMKAFNDMEDIPGEQIGIGIASFFTVSLGGALIGFLFGIFTCLFTKMTSHVRVVEPLAMLAFAYLSYIVAELFHWSGIISLIVCGLVQSQYAFHNISRKSNITVKYFVKMISSTADAMIFLFLGFEVVSQPHDWDTGFVLWSVLLCLFYRLVSVFGLTFILNKLDQSRVQPIGASEQFIMWYGGLRGAVCFALVATLRQSFPYKSLFITCTLVVIVFTVFVQGMTIKPLVTACNIKRQQEKSKLLTTELNEHVTDHIMAGMEVLVGYTWGENTLRELINRINDRYLRKWLQKNPLTQDQLIVEFYRDTAIKDHVTYLRGATKKPLTLCEEDRQAMSSIGYTDELETLEEMRPRVDTYRRDRLDTVSRAQQYILRKKRGRTGDNMLANLRSALQQSSIHSIHHTYDPNLTRDQEMDYAHLLREKHSRLLHNQSLSINSDLNPRRTASEYVDTNENTSHYGSFRRAFSEGGSPDASTPEPPMPLIREVQDGRPRLAHQDACDVEMKPFLDSTETGGSTDKYDESTA